MHHYEKEYRMNKSCHSLFMFTTIILLMFGAARAETIIAWDFTKGSQGWRGNGYLQKTSATRDGLEFVGIGIDPWMSGPAFDYPAGKDVLLKIMMKTDSGSSAEIYYGKVFSEKQKVRIDTVPDSQWREYSVFLPSPGEGARLRLDPFPDQGRLEIAWIKVISAAPLEPPEIKKPVQPMKCGDKDEKISAGSLTLQNSCAWNGYSLDVDGAAMATAYEFDSVGYLSGGQPRWMPTNAVGLKGDRVHGTKNMGIIYRADFKDADGVKWMFTRKFTYGSVPDSINVQVEVEVDSDRDVIHIPWLTFFPGLDTFGERKTQALFSGLEYLADEPSSSESDLRGPASVRRVPDPVKITFPLMVILKDGKYIGVIWEPSEYVTAIFDSPDRVFGSGANLLALWAPGVGALRRENSLFAFDTFKLKAGEPVSVRFTIIGGEGDSVVPAIRKYVEIKGLPAVPENEGGFESTVELLAEGWLDSDLHSDGLWRHAVSGGNNFPFGRAADAPAFMLQLAGLTKDGSLAERLQRGAARGMERLAEIDPGTGKPYDADFRSGVGHVRFPVPSLLFGRMPEYVEQSVAEAQQTASNNFDSNGIRRYTPYPGRPDYGSTHFANHANGLAATDVYNILNAARLSGDDTLLEKGLRLLDRITELYANSEPRGAQTWEIPLHTPDILASAYLVKCYVIAYTMTGDQKYLEQAEYWAWTGVPFVYLYNPMQGRVGQYSTIAVYGSTNWQSPVWIGLPVQWCGLVYASALYMLSDYDSTGPWLQIAKGITATGLQMTYPTDNTSRQGLLPDSYNLKNQWRNGPDINPGTVQANLGEINAGGRIYDFKRLPGSGWLIHAPCRIGGIRESENEIQISLDGFVGAPYNVLIAKVSSEPKSVVSASGARVKYEYFAGSRLLVLEQLVGRMEIFIK
jgi:hypothetical protein